MLCDHNRGHCHLRSPGKKRSRKTIRDLEVRYMFLGQFFAKNAKNDPKTLFEASKSVKNKIRKISVKSLNDVKSACFFHVLCHISAIFKDIDLKLCEHIHQPLPSNILYCFLKILILRVKILKKKKMFKILFFLLLKFSKF